MFSQKDDGGEQPSSGAADLSEAWAPSSPGGAVAPPPSGRTDDATPEPGAEADPVPVSADALLPAGPDAIGGHHAVGAGGAADGEAPPAGYRPPPSPAYVPPPAPPTITYARPGPGPGPRPDTPVDRTARRGWHLLIAGVALVGTAGVVAAVAAVTGGSDEGYSFGEVSAASDGVVVHTGDGDSGSRPLEPGETVLAGWVVETSGASAATVELAGGGIVRFDSGARLTFVDLAADPQTGSTTGSSQPAIRITGGRAWVNPADDTAVEVQIPDGRVESNGNPMALVCADDCSVEAPAGGVTIVSSGDREARPVGHEVVTLRNPETYAVALGEEPSAWARQNLDADEADDLPAPADDDSPGIRGSAVLDGAYLVTLDVVGEPTGDPIPAALQYAAGGSYAVNLSADGSSCEGGTCAVPVSAVDGASGTAQVTEGAVALTFSQPIDCYDESYTSVVVPDIGTTTVLATLDITAVAHDGDRWLVREVEGAGTVAATLTTACNPGDVLGTSASQVTIVGA
jgi:hypothetical protein